MAYRFQKHYTRDEARGLLPQVRQWLKRTVHLQADLQKLEGRLGGLMAPGADLGGDLVNTVDSDPGQPPGVLTRSFTSAKSR